MHRQKIAAACAKWQEIAQHQTAPLSLSQTRPTFVGPIHGMRVRLLKTFASEIALAVSLLASPEAPKPDPATVQQTICMARNIYHEARGEPAKGQAAVAYVVLNRTKSSAFPNKPCDVIFQRSQFSWTKSKRNAYPSEWAAYERAMNTAVQAMNGKLSNPIGRATYFHAARLGRPGWTSRLQPVATIGRHKFLAGRG